MGKILGTLLGAGKGVLGTVIRMAITAIATWLITKGYIDGATGASIAEQVIGVLLAVISALGSKLNNDAQLAKTPNS